MEFSAKDLRVLVTAGAAGIGRVIARTFVEHGARVHICDIDEKALAETKKQLPAVSQTVADVARLDDVERLFEDVKKILRGLDVLVNNAGIAGPTAKVEDIRPEDWDRCIAVDLNGMFYCTRKAMPLIKAAGGGSIINLSSAAGRLAFPMRTPYSAAKWAIVGFTESLAAEAGPDKVRVNCIQPGIVEGERIDRVIAAKAKGLGLSERRSPQAHGRGREHADHRHPAGHRRHGALPRDRRAAHLGPGDLGLRRDEVSRLRNSDKRPTVVPANAGTHIFQKTGPREFTNEVQHSLRGVLQWGPGSTGISRLKRGVRLPGVIRPGNLSGRSLQRWIASHRALLGAQAQQRPDGLRPSYAASRPRRGAGRAASLSASPSSRKPF